MLCKYEFGIAQHTSVAWRPNQRCRKQFLVVRIPMEQGHHHNDDQAARRPHILCSICVHSFGALAKAVHCVLYKAAQRHKFRARKCLIKSCSPIDIVVDLQPFSCNFKGDLSTQVLRVGGTWGRRQAHSIARPWVPISSPLTPMVYLLLFWGLFS